MCNLLAFADPTILLDLESGHLPFIRVFQDSLTGVLPPKIQKEVSNFATPTMKRRKHQISTSVPTKMALSSFFESNIEDCVTCRL
ncbi:hypothetical protein ACU8KH_06665 [Lachancea thermotolerans]